MKSVYTLILALAIATLGYAQTFTNSSDALPENLNSGGCVAVTDMNGDGFDDILTLDQSSDIVIFYQNLDGVSGFTMKSFGSISTNNQWGMAVADVNNDGHKDVFAGGSYDGVHYCQITDPDTHELVELNIQMFMQCVNLADIDNDGWLDAFGCHDDAESNIWKNNGTGDLDLQNDMIDMATTPASDNSGNYGSVWSDYDNDNDLDLFIAKCRQFVQDPQDPRRINAAYINDGNNSYSDEAFDRGLVIYEQSWTVDFADMDNDGDFDCLLTNHSTNMMIFENDGKGYFSDVTAGSGLGVDAFFLQAKMADFDNDGYVDLLTSGGDNDAHGFYRNNGDMTFTDISITQTLPANDVLHSFGIGDLNKDGYLDIYASYGDTYVNADNQNDDQLWMNDGGFNNFIGFDLTGTVSNLDAVGAKIQIYGDFGTQIREVRAGESYGITNSNMVHFGLGTNSMVDYAVIKWPSGIVTVLEDYAAGEYYEVEETNCTAADLTVMASTEVICEGQTAVITADTDGVVLWSNGEIGSSIEVTGGNYSAVSVIDDGCASLSNTVCVLVTDQIESEVNVLGQLEFCEGNSVMLEAPAAVSYEWSNDSDAQVIEVTESGEYSVTMEGACGETVSSQTISVTVLDGPDSEPIVTDVDDSPGEIDVTAQGDDVVWFSDAAGTDIIGTGNTLTLNVTDDITIYAANQVVYGDLVEEEGGKDDISEPGQHHNNSNNGLVFTANEDIVIRDVTVFANGDGEREIVVYSSDFEVIEVGTFYIPDGESIVELNFEVPEGEDYIMITTDNNPQLWRDAEGSGVSYPYPFGDLGAVTGTTINGGNEFNFYYFFYRWNVESATSSCYSEIVPVNINVGIEELESISAFSLYPNPASTELNYEYSGVQSGDLEIALIDAQGKTVLKEFFTTSIGAQRGTLNVTGLAQGVYTFTVIENGKVAQEQIVIE